MLNNSIGILATGHYLPVRVISNGFFEQYLDTTERWIVEHTGIRTRHIAAANEHPSSLATKALEDLMTRSGVSKDDVSALLLSTNVGDSTSPATACIVQNNLGLRRAASVDLRSACMGFLHGLILAHGLASAGDAAMKVLLVASEMPSRWNDPFDRETCVLFGDGAGAALIGRVEAGAGFLASAFDTDGALGHLTGISAGGTREPITAATLANRRQYGFMKGRDLYREALRVLPAIVNSVLERASLSLHDVDLFVPHQANVVLLDDVRRRIGIPRSKVFINCDRVGNTSSASIPIALDEAVCSGRVAAGANVVLFGIGAGLGWGAVAVRWSASAVAER